MKNYWSTLLIMVLTFVGTFHMQSFLSDIWAVYILLFGAVFAFIVLAGIAMEKSWASAMRTIFFSASIGVAALLFYNVNGGHFVFSGVLFINLVGLVSSILDEPDDFDFESVELPELVQASNLPSENMPPPVVLTSEPVKKKSAKNTKRKVKKAAKKSVRKSRK